MGSMKGMFGQNPVQTGTNILGMGMEMAFKKQAMDLDMKQKQMDMQFEKQKFNLLGSIQKAEEKRNKILFQQQMEDIKNQKAVFKKMSDLVRQLRNEDGSINMDIANQIAALETATTGKVNKTFVELLQPKEQKVVGNRIMQGTDVVGELPETQREIEAKAEKKRKEEEAKAEKLRKEKEQKAKEAKKEYDRKLDDRIDALTKQLKEKEELKNWSARAIEDEAKKQLGEEAFRDKRGYLPIRGEWKEPGYLGRLGNLLGIGPDFNLAGNLNVKHVPPKLNLLNQSNQSQEEQEFIDYLIQNKKMTLNQARSFAKDALK